MKTEQELKALVKEKYSQIALQPKQMNESSCCGATTCCGDEVYNIMSEDYNQLGGYVVEADLGLGCGLPTEFAQIKAGDVVVDLGSGAGNDAFVARELTGEHGKVIGIDFTEAMIELARKNAEKLQYHNVEFRQGDIESIPMSENTADVVVSNCVLNLVPNKKAVFKEIYRILKPGGHFSISDIVLEGELPEKWKEVAEFYAGCVSGAIQKNAYLGIIEEVQFLDIRIQKDKTIAIPKDILAQYLSADEIAKYQSSATRITSITVFGRKPIKASCCTPGSGCCS